MKKSNAWKIIFIIISIIVLSNNIYLIYNIAKLHSIENILRFVIVLIIIVLALLLVFLNIKAYLKKKTWFSILLTVIEIIIMGAILFVNVNFNMIYSRLHKVTTNYTTYSISLVTLNDNQAKNIKDINNTSVAVINDREIENGYNFVKEVIDKANVNVEIKEYDNYFEIIDDILNKKIKYAFLPSNYGEAFSSVEGYENLNEKIKSIHEASKQEQHVASNKSINEPFTILLMGVDGTGDGIKNMTANGDSLVLITFNPNTLNATMVSIPRDSYVPISCMNKKNKITHSSWGGDKCIINTIQNFTGINIDYYLKVNFNGLVKLVDTLGGIDINIEYSFCEQDSKRRFGENTIYVEKGYQTINGEQALAYARNRHPNPTYCSSEWTNYTSNDFIRGEHQQEIIKSLLNKIKNIRDLNTIYDLLDTISDNMETNMSMDTMLSFYNIAKDLAAKFKVEHTIDKLVNIQKLYLKGYGAYIYDYSQVTNSGSRLLLWDYVPYNGSVEDITKAMKVNLGLEKEEVIKTFEYDISSPYVQTVIGKKTYNEAGVKLLPNFVGKTKSEVQEYADKNNIKLTIEYVSESEYKAGQVVSQDPGEAMDISEMTSTKGLKIIVMEGNKPFDYNNCTKEDYKDDTRCSYVDYTSKSYESFASWISTYSSIKKNITYNIIDEKNDEYNVNKAGLIKTITINDEDIDADSIYEIKDKKIIVTYYAVKKEEETTNTEENQEEDNDTEEKEDD